MGVVIDTSRNINDNYANSRYFNIADIISFYNIGYIKDIISLKRILYPYIYMV